MVSEQTISWYIYSRISIYPPDIKLILASLGPIHEQYMQFNSIFFFMCQDMLYLPTSVLRIQRNAAFVGVQSFLNCFF